MFCTGWHAQRNANRTMSGFAKLRTTFDANCTTVLVGWKGLGALSPWPSHWAEFPPLLLGDEIARYADERSAASSDSMKLDLIAELLSLDLRTGNRQTIEDVLSRLSALDRGDPRTELRKWRLVLLEELLENLPEDPLYGLPASIEFWRRFGFPSDSPREVQGGGAALSPSECYRQENLDRLLECHWEWVECEKRAIGR